MSRLIETLGLLGLLMLLLGGCATQPSQPTHYYRLAQPEQPAGEGRPSTGQPLLGVGPLRLASYLDRPQLVRRSSPYRIELDDFHHWAGGLQENILQLLTSSLGAQLGERTLVAYPWDRAVRPAYQLQLDVDRLDAQAGQVWLRVRWTLVRSHDEQLLAMGEQHFSEPLTGGGNEAYVAAISRAVLELGRRLAEALQGYL